MRTTKFVVFIILLTVVLLTGCAGETAPIKGASMSGATLDEENAGERFPFTAEVAEGEPIGIDVRGTLIEGSLTVALRSMEGEIVWEESFESPGPFATNTVVYPETGSYELGMTWDGPVMATITSLMWRPEAIEVPEISPLALIGGVGMILVAIGFVVYAGVRRLSWAYLGLGALAWAITVAIKFAWAAAINPRVYAALTGALPEIPAHVILYVYVGLLTGIFEVGIVWLVMRYTRLGQAHWKQALGFGIGFGAVEALLLGLSSLASVALAIAAPDTLPPAILEQIALLNNLLYAIGPIWERFFTVMIHIFCNVLIFYAVMKRQPRWFWASFAYKSGLDAVAAFAQFWGIGTVGRLWAIEAIVGLFGLVAWWGTRKVAENYPEVTVEAPAESS